MNDSQFINSKELSTILECSKFKVYDYEEKLGLKPHRDKNFRRPIRWHKKPAMDIIRAAGYTI